MTDLELRAAIQGLLEDPQFWRQLKLIVVQVLVDAREIELTGKVESFLDLRLNERDRREYQAWQELRQRHGLDGVKT